MKAYYGMEAANDDLVELKENDTLNNENATRLYLQVIAAQLERIADYYRGKNK